MDKDDDTNQDETAGKARFPCLPSLIALQQMRNRLNVAMSGKKLMKWKSVATGRELRRIAKEITTVYDSFSENVGNAFILLARCRYFYPNLNKMVVHNFPTKPCVTVGVTTKSIAGCKLMSFNFEDNCPDSYPCLGIDKGGETILEAKKLWHELLRRMIQMETLRLNFIALDIANQNANKKANVLGKVIIPRTQITIRYILGELEELAREEFFRLKKILEVKYRHKKKNQQKVAVKKEEEEKRPPLTPQPELKLPPPILKPAGQSCINCDGPMHPEGEKTKLIYEKRKQASAKAELKEKLSKVLVATSEYEKNVKEKDSVREFKQTTETLKKKLSVPPKVIPDDVDSSQLCDVCRSIFYKQDKSKCIVCGDPIKAVEDAKNLAVAKVSKRKLQIELDTLLDAIQEYEWQGLQDEKVNEYKVTAAELRDKLMEPPIPKNVDVNRLCNDCKERMEFEPECEICIKERGMPKTSKVSIKLPSNDSMKQGASDDPMAPMASNAPSSEQNSSALLLGVFETEEITEIIRVRNPDGTISEKRRTITIKKRPGKTSSPENSSFKENRNIGHVTVHHRGLMGKLPRNAHSEYAISSLPMADQMVRACTSSNIDYYDELLESITELTRPALQSSHGSQTNATAEIVKGLISAASLRFGDLESADDSPDWKKSDDNPQSQSIHLTES